MASEKLKALRLDEGDAMPMDMSSMIDLVFLLLIFFMVSSHLIIVQIDKRVAPPHGKKCSGGEKRDRACRGERARGWLDLGAGPG